MASMISAIIFIASAAGVLGLGEVVMIAPAAVRAGSSLALACHYELDTAPLYSIKFYLEDQEFYRYVPKEAPPTRVFALPGVRVDGTMIRRGIPEDEFTSNGEYLLRKESDKLQRSNATVVFLERVEKELSGYYKCEVSDDAPYFQTVIRRTQVFVTEEPEDQPELRVDKTKFALGERIRANCTSRSGYPAANLTFYINNYPVHKTEGSRIWSSVEAERSGLETAHVEVEVIASAYMFRDYGRAQLACSASQFHLYSRTVSVYIFEDTPQLAHVLGSSSTHKGAGINKGYRTSLFSNFLFAILCVLVTFS